MTYAEFWPRYLAAHAEAAARRPRSALVLARLLGDLGLADLPGAVLLAFALTRAWWWLVAAPVVGYGCAWTAHLVFEHNKPETFGHPFWSLYSDFRMLALFLAGRLET